GGSNLPTPETVAIEFEGRRFLWHVVELLDGVECWPTVTTPVSHDAADEEATRLAMERLLSAIAFMCGQGIDVVTAAVAAVPDEFDPPVAAAHRRGFVDHLHDAPAEIVVLDDDRLRPVLGYFRDALGTSSPYFKFLAFWDALDVACDDYAGGLKAWIGPTMASYPHMSGRHDPPPPDWWHYLWMDQRGAVAHAIRDPQHPPEIDPDDPE